MNCQQHDLAMVVDARNNNDGRTCTCLRFVGRHAEITDRYVDLWHVDRPMTWIIDGVVAELPYAPDQFLRRICPGVDGQFTGTPTKLVIEGENGHIAGKDLHDNGSRRITG